MYAVSRCMNKPNMTRHVCAPASETRDIGTWRQHEQVGGACGSHDSCVVNGIRSAGENGVLWELSVLPVLLQGRRDADPRGTGTLGRTSGWLAELYDEGCVHLLYVYAIGFFKKSVSMKLGRWFRKLHPASLGIQLAIWLFWVASSHYPHKWFAVKCYIVRKRRFLVVLLQQKVQPELLVTHYKRTACLQLNKCS